MNRGFCSSAAIWSSVLRLAARSALFAGAGLICAQAPAGPAAESKTAVSGILAEPSAANSSSAIPSSSSNPAPSVPLAAANPKSGSGNGTGFGLPQTQFPAPAADSFQCYRGFQGGGTGLVSATRPAGGYSRFSGANPAGVSGTIWFGLQGGSSLKPTASPNFNQVMRANIALPFASSTGTSKLTYRDMLVPGANGTGSTIGQDTTGALFSTTSLGNGMFFYAGTNLGKGPMAGTPPGGFGSNSGATGPKASRPAVTLKLSF